jgi:hypothetical protein
MNLNEQTGQWPLEFSWKRPHGFAIAQNAQEFDLYVDPRLAFGSYD